MLPDRVSNPGPLTYESSALPIALRGLASHPCIYLGLLYLLSNKPWLITKQEVSLKKIIIEGYRAVGSLTFSVPDVISGRGDVGLITLVYVYFTQITLRVCCNVTCVRAQILSADGKVIKHVQDHCQKYDIMKR